MILILILLISRFWMATFLVPILNDVYNSQLIRFARVSGHLADINAGNETLPTKLLYEGYRYQVRKLCLSFIVHTMKTLTKPNET